MDPRFQTSFIPKKPITASAARTPTAINLFSLLATVIFIAALAVSGGVFFYKSILQKQIDSDKASLDRARGAFEPDLINRIIRLDTRLETGKKLLAAHLAVTPFFDFLSSVTLKPVRFKDFNFSYLAPDKILVTMKGQAASYAAVALESDLLNSKKSFKNTIISDMALDPQGTVSFSLSTVVDPSLVSYAASLTGIGSDNSQPASSPTTAPVQTQTSAPSSALNSLSAPARAATSSTQTQ